MTSRRDTQRVRDAWNTNARFWDERMGEGNDFFNLLTWPAIERLLALEPGERVLDIGCGNGLTSRRLAAAGAQVTAFDLSEAMVAIARDRSNGHSIDFHVLDATDEATFARFQADSFDGAVANMVLMDMSAIEPLMRIVARLLRPMGRFAFSVMHPCFNNPSTVHIGERQDREGVLVSTYSIAVSRYRTAYTQAGLAINGQPIPHPYFHRPLTELFGAGFAAGLIVDGLEEPAFSADTASADPLGWNGRFSEVPPALVVRLRKRV